MIRILAILLLCCFFAHQSYAGLGSREVAAEQAKALRAKADDLSKLWSEGDQKDLTPLMISLAMYEQVFELLGEETPVKIVEKLAGGFYLLYNLGGTNIEGLKKSYNYCVKVMCANSLHLFQLTCTIALRLFLIEKNFFHIQNAKKACDLCAEKFPQSFNADFSYVAASVYYNFAKEQEIVLAHYQKALEYCNKALAGNINNLFRAEAFNLKIDIEAAINGLLKARNIELD